MPISLDEINRVTLRVYQPRIEADLRELGVSLPTPWTPSDDELARIAEAYGKAYAEVYGLSEEPE